MSQHDHNQKRVLIVEDEALIAMNIQMDLEDMGHRVVGTCYNLPEGIDAAKSWEFDGAILDVDLKGIDVFPVAEELKKRDIPFVFHTGHGDRNNITNRFPRSKVLRKPTDTPTIFTALFG